MVDLNMLLSSTISFKNRFIQEQVQNGKVELIYCKMDEMIAEFMTKGLSNEKFEAHGWNGITIEHPGTSEEC